MLSIFPQNVGYISGVFKHIIFVWAFLSIVSKSGSLMILDSLQSTTYLRRSSGISNWPNPGHFLLIEHRDYDYCDHPSLQVSYSSCLY